MGSQNAVRQDPLMTQCTHNTMRQKELTTHVEATCARQTRRGKMRSPNMVRPRKMRSPGKARHWKIDIKKNLETNWKMGSTSKSSYRRRTRRTIERKDEIEELDRRKLC